MNPSHVRERILLEHEKLRQRLEELDDAVSTLLDNHATAPRVAELTRDLLVELDRHTELEDNILAPALMDIDAWGPIRAEQLLEHHRSQRAEIRELQRLFGIILNPHDIARVARSIAKELRADMDFEEKDVLSADLLRDDVISVASDSG